MLLWNLLLTAVSAMLPPPPSLRLPALPRGTLFTYFKTKDELINELFRELRKEIDRELVGYPFTADPRTRLRFIWDRFLNLA